MIASDTSSAYTNLVPVLLQDAQSSPRVVDLINSLPSHLRDNLIAAEKASGGGNAGIDTDNLGQYLVAKENKSRGSIQRLITTSVASIVKRTSRSQSAKGILTAGVVKSFAYALEKVKKMNSAKR